MSDSIIRARDWLSDEAGFRGEWQGEAHAVGLSVIANRIDAVGGGPRLHRHPYAEIFVMRRGRALFTLGEARIEAQAGEIVVAPAGVAHTFENLGPGPMESLDIHDSGRFETEWLQT